MKKVKAPYVAIEFMDHSYGSYKEAGIIPCEVVGRLIYKDKYAYWVASWIANSELDNENNEVFAIGRGLVTKVRKLR